MQTFANGFRKTHKGCGGIVKYIEDIELDSPSEWDLFCVDCDKFLTDEEVEFKPIPMSSNVPRPYRS